MDDTRGFDAYVPPEVSAFVGEVRYDGFAIFGSLFLLTLLLAIMFERVLGLDQIFAKFMKDRLALRKERKREQLSSERLKLENLFDDKDKE